MFRCRRFGVLVVLGLAAAFAAAPAEARPPAGPATIYPETLTTEHFQIHYTGEISDPENPDRIVHQKAGDLAANAERAYDLFVTQWGFTPPKDDGDGRLDVWVQEQLDPLTLGVAYRETAAPSTAWVSIAPAEAQSAHVIAHELMHAIQYATAVTSDSWLLESTAEWAAFTFTGYTDIEGSDAAPDMSLDCDSQACGNDGYEIGGYSRWGFFQYLSERYGTSLVKSVFAKGKEFSPGSKNGRDLLSETLVDKGTSLASAFNDYTAAHVAGAYTVKGMKDAPPATFTSVSVGKKTAPLLPVKVAVNHLAARYVKLARDTTSSGDCYAATLALTVALPAGTSSRPTFFATSVGTTAIPLTVNGNTATLSVPWSTCAVGGDGYLALPNPSYTADARDFTVSGSLTVSTTSLVAPSVPPPPFYTGPSVSAPTAAVAPSIIVHGAELVRVPAATRVVRLLVFSTGDGQLRATAGDVVLGTVALRAGNNEVRFVLPAATVKAIRRTSAVRSLTNALALTSLSPEGVAGDTVMRTLAVVASPAPTATKTKKATKKVSRR